MGNRREGYVYFFAERNSSLVKIGFSCDPQHRLGSVKSNIGGKPLEILACYPGTRADEKAEHQRWAEYRLPRSEWFTKNRDLTNYIAAIAAAAEFKPEQVIKQESEWTATAEGWAAYLIERIIESGEARSPREARAVIATRYKITPSRLYSLWRRRMKDLPSHDYHALWAGFVAEKQAELKTLQDEVAKLTSDKESYDRQTAAITAYAKSVLARDTSKPATLKSVAQDIAAVRLALGLPVSPDKGGANG